ncbi:MAG: VWA domain-containing protein [Fimbriimonadaceae bacterium]|nr:VWA domain-containing protein [Fimbriimonadaceae bacterium]
MELNYLLPGLRLAQPAALWLLALLPGWLLLAARARRGGGLSFPLGHLPPLPRSWRVRLQPLPDLLRALALALLVLALARPQMGQTHEKITAEGVDIMLAIDVSASMRVEDVAPNRLEAAKAVIQRFVEKLTNDRVGIVVFAGRSFTQCPLTTDYGTVWELVRTCHIGMVPYDGTAVGDALGTCVARFETDAWRRAQVDETDLPQRRKASEQAKQRSRVVILLTDGFSNSGDLHPRSAAEMARIKNIRVHCIGLGSPEGAPVPYYDQSGRRQYLRSNGRLLVSPLDEKGLQAIAAACGGQYFRAGDASALQAIYETIAAMERHEVEVSRRREWDERFILPLLAAVVVLLLELWLRATALRVTP